MGPISNVDRIAILLRQKLLERAKTAGSDKAGNDIEVRRQMAGGFEAVRALVAIEGVDERQRRRAFIQSILCDQFGADLVNDAQFQQLVGRVSQAIEDDEISAALLSRLIIDLRSK
jgi:hypothetical protein